ncbi:14301_t:CDS:2 [Funneliformis geosporum]|uniref:11119_t:CDS:1 n=1 Tax=Funneliformis geosporum TaxID=1117311 RepID=A0A9W4SM49_9GLOM|nr:14301_t:CDS:2 [Funneliformis geosporum]CAI2172016.1 11119_t:CDS:2 [Funneliformis geosporum]
MGDLNSIPYNGSKPAIIISLTLLTIDLIACLYIFVRTFLRWKQLKRLDKNSLPMSLRFPFYIALIEFSLSIIQIINLSRPAILNNVWQDPMCSIMGYTSVFLFNFVMNLVTFIIFITWYQATRDIDLSFGRFDCVIFIIVTTIASFYTLLGVGEYGETHSWCTIQSYNFSILSISLVIITINMSLIFILYLNTYLYLKRRNLNGRDSPEDEKTKEIFSYAFAFACQLLILLIYTVTTIIKLKHDTIDIIFIFGIINGGLLITILYIINEGWWHKPIPLEVVKHHSQDSSVRTMSSVPNSFRLTENFPFTKIQVEVIRQQTTQQRQSGNFF